MEPIFKGKLNPRGGKDSPQEEAAEIAEKRSIVLYVEDDPTNRTIVKERLEQSYEVHVARDAKEACFFLADRGTELDFILMDIELQDSDMDGIQLTSLIRGMANSIVLPKYAELVPTLDVPIIFVTAYGHKYDEKRLLLAGGNLVIRKPVNFVALKLALTEIELKKNKEKFRQMRNKNSSTTD